MSDLLSHAPPAPDHDVARPVLDDRPAPRIPQRPSLADAGRQFWGRHRRVLWPLTVYAASRLLVLVTAVAATLHLEQIRDPGRGPWPRLPGTNYLLIHTLSRWDGAWYVRLAGRGYPSAAQLPTHLKEAAFFPLLPGLMRVMSAVTGLSLAMSGVVISLAFGALACVLVWHLTRSLADAAAADRAVLLLCFFPAAFVFSMPYAESLVIATVAGALIAVAHRRWVTAGLLAAVATAARPNAAPILLALACAAVVEIRRRPAWRPVAAPVLGSLGLASAFGFLWWKTGRPLVWLTAEHEAWHDRIDGGWNTLVRAVHMVTSPHASLESTGLLDLVGLLGLLFAVAGLVALWRWRPPLAVWVYGVSSIALAFASFNVGVRPRMLLSAFPLVVAVAIKVRGRLFAAMLTCSAVALVLLSLVTFTNVAAAP